MNDGFLGREDLCGLGHESDTTEDNDVGVCVAGSNGEAERVSAEVSNSKEDIRGLVGMGKDYSVFLLCKVAYA